MACSTCNTCNDGSTCNGSNLFDTSNLMLFFLALLLLNNGTVTSLENGNALLIFFLVLALILGKSNTNSCSSCGTA